MQWLLKNGPADLPVDKGWDSSRDVLPWEVCKM